MGKTPARRFFGITGTPGTGKKTIAPLVAKQLALPSFGLNELAISYGLLKPSAREAEVDTEALRRKVSKELTGPALIYGHLLPYVLGRRSVVRVVVFRCEPSVLKRRLLARRYAFDKVVENVEAELIGVVSSDARSAFGEQKTAEFDTSATDSESAAESIAKMLQKPGGSRPLIDWTLDYDSASKLKSLLSESNTEYSLRQTSDARDT